MSSLRKHSFLHALRRWGRFARNVPGCEERGETDVFAGYCMSEKSGLLKLAARAVIYYSVGDKMHSLIDQDVVSILVYKE